MKKAILWFIIGLLLGVGIFPIISVYIFRTAVKGSTSGCIGLALGIILFVIVLGKERSKKKDADEEKK